MSYKFPQILSFFVSFFDYWLDQILIIMPGSANLEFWRGEKQNKTKKQKKNKKIFRLCFWLNEECPKLLSSLGIDHRREDSREKKSS